VRRALIIPGLLMETPVRVTRNVAMASMLYGRLDFVRGVVALSWHCPNQYDGWPMYEEDHR
jgi:hypothetical protein